MEGEDGASATQAITQKLIENRKELTRDAISVWHAEAQKRLYEAQSTRSGLDDTRDQRGGLIGRQMNSLEQIAKSFTTPIWDGEKWQFSVSHGAAAYHEWGVQPHEITPNGPHPLAFQWPDAPDDVVRRFSPGPKDEVNRSQWDGWVYFDRVEHPGIPGIGYLRYGREQARRRLRKAGYDVSGFGVPEVDA